MKRGVALIASTLVLGACGISVAKHPAVYAQLHPARAPSALDVWRDKATQELTFHWHNAKPSEALRYVPARSILARLSGGHAHDVTWYHTSAAAWNEIHALYGVKPQSVRAALLVGSPSQAPPTAGAIGVVQTHPDPNDFGQDLTGVAAATGLAVPRLSSLRGHLLTDAFIGGYRGPGADSGPVASLSYGREHSGDWAITMNVARETPRSANAWGTAYRQMFRSHSKHGAAGAQYAVSGSQIVFPYRSSEWIALSPISTLSWEEASAMVRAILAAPTAGGKGPAVYSHVLSANPDRRYVGIWLDPKGRITFDAGPPVIVRYDPSRLMLTELDNTRALGSTRFLSDGAAWAAIHRNLGITKTAAMRALTSGTASAEPDSYRMTAWPTSHGRYSVSTDYGTDIARIAKATGLELPQLASLAGYPLKNASFLDSGVAWFTFSGARGSGLELEISAAQPGNRDAPGNSFRQLFEHTRRHERIAGIPVVSGGGDVFPFRGEWAMLSPSPIPTLSSAASAKRWALTARVAIRAIASAPTVG